MTRLSLRLTLLLLAALSVFGAAYYLWTIERRGTALTEHTRALDTRLAAAVRQTFDLRSAQQGYVTVGQNAEFWIPKVTSTIASLKQALPALERATTRDSSRLAIQNALHALQEFERMDRRASDFAARGHKVPASDLIFSDGLETTEEIITALEQTRFVEHAEAAVSAAAGRRRQAMVAVVAAAVPLIVIALFVAGNREEPMSSAGRDRLVLARRQAEEAAARRALEVDDEPEAFEFKPLAKPAVEQARPAAAAAAPPPAPLSEVPSVETQHASAVPALPPPADLTPEVQAVANVCNELARLADTASLPALLERAAAALDASGVMLWVADPEARELTAIAAHGYPANILSRVGTIPRDAANVTALAFRTGLLQTLNADQDAVGALAAPLVNPSGCIGVMSAEVRQGGERKPARLALATIVAAQLATLVAPAVRVHKSEAV